jgi:hypothetical protein
MASSRTEGSRKSKGWRRRRQSPETAGSLHAGAGEPAHHQPGRGAARQPQFAQGGPARPQPAGRLHPAGEDHPLRPRAHPRARGACARRRRPRLLRADAAAGGIHQGRFPAGGRQPHAGVRALLHRGRLARLGRHGARRARLRRQVLHPRRQLRPGGQQHPGVLHPGRDEVPGPGARHQARAAPRDAAGLQRARHLLGLHLADARELAHADVADVGPGDPAQLPDDGRLRRPHLPLGQRARRVALRQVPLAAQAGQARAGLGRGAEDRRQGPRLPPQATCGKRSTAATSPSGNWACS